MIVKLSRKLFSCTRDVQFNSSRNLSRTMSKITELLSKSKRDFRFSFEITPEISIKSLETLSVEPVEPLFYSVTWHSKSHYCKDLNIGQLNAATYLSSRGKNVVLHITCDMMRATFLKELLCLLQEKNIRNLLVMLGEKFEPTLSDFQNSKELIRYIRQISGEYFCIGVVGFPDCSDSRLTLLKDKINEGADFIITQAFFEPELYKTYVRRCRQINITVPIIPGLFLYETEKELMSFVNLCKVKISENCAAQNVTCRESVKNLIQDLRDSEILTRHFHFFTMNKLQKVLDFVVEIK